MGIAFPWHSKTGYCCEPLCALEGPNSGLFCHTKAGLWRRELAFKRSQKSMAGVELLLGVSWPALLCFSPSVHSSTWRWRMLICSWSYKAPRAFAGRSRFQQGHRRRLPRNTAPGALVRWDSCRDGAEKPRLSAEPSGFPEHMSQIPVAVGVAEQSIKIATRPLVETQPRADPGPDHWSCPYCRVCTRWALMPCGNLGTGQRLGPSRGWWPE